MQDKYHKRQIKKEGSTQKVCEISSKERGKLLAKRTAKKQARKYAGKVVFNMAKCKQKLSGKLGQKV